MEDKKKKCSYSEHKEIDAIYFCPECKLYICNKCINYHKGFFENHNIYNLDKDINEIFTGICKEKDHFDKLEYFCKNHNKLCCGACLCKIKDEINGRHKDCNVCKIKDIKEEKKNKLKENIQSLEELSKTLEESIKKLKIIFEKKKEDKEELKLKIKKIFIEIRNTLNDIENKLLVEIDKHFNELLIKEDIINNSEKLSNKIKISLEKGKIIYKEWIEDNNKLNSLINDCLNIENNIKAINIVNENTKKSNSFNIRVKFSLENV